MKLFLTFKLHNLKNILFTLIFFSLVQDCMKVNWEERNMNIERLWYNCKPINP